MTATRTPCRIAAAVLTALWSVGCGGSPSGPAPVAGPTPAPAAPTARDGWTEGPVAATFMPPAPFMGAPVSAAAPGFLTREAAYRGEALYLWPQDDEYVRALVYHEFVPGRRLSRWTAGFAISMEGLDGIHLDTATEAIAEASRATGLDIRREPSGPVVVVADPGDPYFVDHAAIAYTQLRLAGNTFTSARVVFRSAREISSGRTSGRHNTLLHEIGHVLGLGHSLDPQDVMSIAPERRSERTFGAHELVALKLMYRWRRAGNTAPDREPGIGTASERPAVVVVE